MSRFWNDGLKYIRWWLSDMGHVYPEMVNKVVLINVPWVFWAGWKIAKPWLPKNTQLKIDIFRGDARKLLAPLVDTRLIEDHVHLKDG